MATTDGKEGKPLPVALDALPLPSPEALPGYPDAAKIYASNLRLDSVPALRQWDRLPSVKKVTPAGGHVVLDAKVALTYPDEYAGEAKLLKEKLAALYGLEVADEAPVTIVLEELSDKARAVNAEYYRRFPDKDCRRYSAWHFQRYTDFAVNTERQGGALPAGSYVCGRLPRPLVSRTDDRHCP